MPSSTMSLSARAKAVTLWLFRAAGLPKSLSIYGAFFSGVAAGTLFSPGLFRYIQNHSHDPSKIQLAVFHVIRLFEQRHNYDTLLRNPSQLMAEMEKEVMFMVDRHISANEAGHVMIQIKRRYGVVDVEERPPKRVRQCLSNLHTQAACPRGSVAEEQRPHVPKKSATASLIAALTSVLIPEKSPTAPEEESFGCGQMPGGFSNSRPSLHRSIAPSQEPDIIPHCAPRRTPRHAPEKGSFGLDYESKELYPSDDSDTDSDSDYNAPSGPRLGPPTRPAAYRRSGHPTVVRRLHGLMRAGTSLSPIGGSPANAEAVTALTLQPSPLANVARPSSRPSPPSSLPPPPAARLFKKGRGRGRAEVILIDQPKTAKEEKKAPKPQRNPKWMRRASFTITR